jgi:hypothetical protein
VSSERPACGRCHGTRIEPGSTPPAPCLSCTARRTTFRASTAVLVAPRVSTNGLVRDAAVRM